MADRVIKFRGEFDASQILTSLKNIRSQMAQAGAKDSLFTGVDKDIANAENAMKELLTQAQKGFKNSNEIDQFTKKFEKLDLAFSKIGTELGELNVAENFAQTSPELEKINKELKQIENKNKELKKTALELVDPANKAVFSTIEFRKEISKAIEKEKDLKKAVEEVNKKQSEIGYGTINKAFNKLTSEQKAAATNSIMSSNLQFGLKEGQSVSTDFMNKYREAMSKIIIEGKNAKEVLDQLGKEINEEDRKYAESAQFVEDYAKNLQQLAQGAALAGGMEAGERGNVTQGAKKATAIGGYTTAGTFEFSSQTTALRDLNNEQQRAVSLVQQRETEENRLAVEAQNTARQVNAGLQAQRANQEHATAAQRENINATRQQIDTQETLNNTFSRMSSAVQQLFSLGTAWSTIRRVVRETFQDVQKLDKAFASIAMVTSYSVEEMWGSYDKYAQMANELGQSTESVIQSSALFYQQGLDTAEALELTESTMKLATLAGADFSTATSQMTAALRGFKMEMTEGEHVTDVYSELAAKAAADVNGIAYAMSKTASIASSAGMEFETTAAFLTQMIETTQEAPENIGTAMKTVIARFTELKENVAAVDSEFDDLDYNKVDTALKSVGVQLKDSMGQFRDLDDVFLELSQKWDTLDRNSQRYIATIAAGSRQQSRFIAMMENYDRTLELIDTAQNSAGKSSEQFAKYQDTIESKIKKLQNSWEQLRVKMFNSDVYKQAINSLTKFVDKLNQMDTKKLLSWAISFAFLGKTLATNLIKSFSDIFSTSLIANFRTAITGLETEANSAGNRIGIAFRNGINNSNISSQPQNSLPATQQTTSQNQSNITNRNEQLAIQKTQRSKLLAARADLYRAMDAARQTGNQNSLQRYQQNLDKVNQDLNKVNKELQRLNSEGQQTITLGQKMGTVWAGTGKQVATAFSGAFSSALSTALMGTITSALAGEDIKGSIITGLRTALIVAIPQLLSQLSTILLPKIAASITALAGGTVAIVGVSVLATAAIAVAAANWDKINSFIDEQIDKEEERRLQKALDESQSKVEKVTAASQSAQDKYDEETKTLNNLEEQKEKYIELSAIKNKTTEQQEEYNNLVQELITEIPELEKNYNEINGTLRVTANEWDSIIEKQHQARLESAALTLATKNAQLEMAKRTESDTFNLKQQVAYEEKRTAIYNKLEEQARKSTGISAASSWAQDLHDTWGFNNNDNVAASLFKGGTIVGLGLSAIAEFTEFINKAGNNTNRDFNSDDWNANKVLSQKINELAESSQELKELNEEERKEREEYIKKLKELNEQQIQAQKEQIKGLYGEGISGNIKTNVISERVGPMQNKEQYHAEDFMSGGGMLSFAALDSDIQDLFISMYGSLEDAAARYSELDANTLALLANQAYNSQKWLENVDKIAKELEEEIGIDFDSIIQNLYEMPYEEMKKKIQKYKPDTQKYILDYFNEQKVEAEKTLSQFIGTGIYSRAQNLNTKDYNSFVDSITNFQNQLGNADLANQFLTDFFNTDDIKNLSLEKSMQLFNIFDFEKMDMSNLDEYKKNFIEKAKEFGISGGEELFSSILSQAQKINIYSPTIKDWDAFIEKQNKDFEEEEKRRKSLNELLATSDSQGVIKLDSETRQEWKEWLDETNEVYGTTYKLGDYLDKDMNTSVTKIKELWEDINRLEAQQVLRGKSPEVDEYINQRRNQIPDSAFQIRFSKDVKNYYAALEAETTEEMRKLADKIRDGHLKGLIYEVLAQYDEDSEVKVEASIKNMVSSWSTLAEQQIAGEGLTETAKLQFEKDFNALGEDFKHKKEEYLKNGQLDWEQFYKDYLEFLRSQADIDEEKIAEIQDKYNNLLKTQDEKIKKDAEDAQKAAEKAEKEAEEARKKIEEAEKAQLDFIKSMGGMVSTYKSAASEMIKNGKVTSNTYASLADNIASINEQYNTGMSIDSYINSAGQFNWSQYEKDLESFIIQLRKEGKEAGYLTQVLNDLHDTHEELNKEIKETEKAYEDALNSVKDAEKGVVEANKNLSKAYEDLADKEQAVIEAQQKLNELMYGTEDKRKSALDGMYNYEQLLDVIDSDLESIKTNLDHIGPNDNIAELINSYGQNMRNKKINLEAQKRVYENNLSEILGNIGQYSSYYTMQNGRLLADVAALNRASMNDDIKNEVENQIQMYNDSAKKISDIEKQIKQVEQDFLDFRKTYRDKYINLQEKVISTMKEEAQKELQTQQEKYAALEEADNEYTSALEEAIQKQRDLRSQSTEWEDLAQKEKRLSLLQRDTSGANQKEVLKQQEEIEKSRENLLDKGIDKIIKGLKDLYSDQKKTRDAEIKYQQAVLDNATYIEEANAVINSWQTADDLISWFYEHSQEVQSMTNEQLEAYNEELEGLYNDREIYMNTSMEDFINMLDIQENEIDNTVTNVAEHLTMESTRSLNEVMAKVDEAISEAQKDIDSALKDVQNAKDEITEAIKAVADAVSKLKEANKNAADSAERLARVQEQANKASIESKNNAGNSSNFSNSNQPLEKSRVQQLYEAAINSPGSNEVHFNDNSGVSDSEVAELAEKLGKYVGSLNNKYYYASSLEELGKIMFGGSRITGGYATPSGTFVYEKGGLVDYTGPAWVDGTPAQPEAFLSAKDTQMISNFTDVLRSLYTSIGSSNSQQVNPSIGDTHIEVHINIENVASDYDVDSAVERVKQDIIDAANQTGRNVILYQ